jgi:hypothetical protein
MIHIEKSADRRLDGQSQNVNHGKCGVLGQILDGYLNIVFKHGSNWYV